MGGNFSNSSHKSPSPKKTFSHDILSLSKGRTLDGREKGMKISNGYLKCKWFETVPEVSILRDTIRIEDKEKNAIEIKGDQDSLKLAGFRMMTRCIEEDDGRKGYALGINTKLLNLATFEIEVEPNGNVVLTGRKLKRPKEGRLRLVTPDVVTPKDVSVKALNDNRIVWIRIYYGTPIQSSAEDEKELDFLHPAQPSPKILRASVSDNSSSSSVGRRDNGEKNVSSPAAGTDLLQSDESGERRRDSPRCNLAAKSPAITSESFLEKDPTEFIAPSSPTKMNKSLTPTTVIPNPREGT